MSRLTAKQQRLFDNAVLITATRLLFNTMRENFPCPRLSEIVIIHNGQSLPQQDRNQAGKYNVYAAGGLVGHHSAQLTDMPFVVIGRKGSAGKPTYAPLGGWVIDTAYYAQAKNEAQLNCKFLFYAISSLDFAGDIISTAIPGINRTSIYRYSIPLPPRNIQEACVQFLDVAAEKTGKYPILPAPLEQLRRIVTRVEELMGKFEEVRSLRQKALEESEALTKAAMRQIFKPHENYQEVSLESVCAAIIDNLHSNPVYSDNGVPCIRSSDVGWGALYLHTARCTSEEEYKRRTVRGEPIPNDIVLVREGGGTGKAAIVLEGQRFSLGQRVMMLRPDKNKVIPKFFLYQILSPSVYEDQIIPRCKGSASPHLNIGALRKFNFFLPPLPKQHRIVNYLDELQTKVDTIKRQREQAIKELDALLPSILDKAFKGEL